MSAAAAGEGELQMRIKKLESVVKRQRSVVREQKDSIAVLIASVDELQRSLACKDTEIARLRGKCGAPSHKESADGDTENIGGLQQELRAQRDETRRVHEQLAASRERERALEAHVAQLQRANMAEGGSPSSLPSRTPPPHELRVAAQSDISPAWPPMASSPPSNNGTPSTTHQAQLGKVRDNLLAAESAIEKLRLQAATAMSASPLWHAHMKRSAGIQNSSVHTRGSSLPNTATGGAASAETEPAGRASMPEGGRGSPCLSDDAGAQV